MRIVLLSIILLFTYPVEVQAGNADVMQGVKRLEQINKRKPEQSSNYERSKDVLSGRMLDKTNRVVGKLNDIVLDRSGSIEMLDINFDRLRIDAKRLNLNYGQFGIRPASNGYKMSYTDDQIIELVPELLANIETASGRNTNTYSVKKLIGRTVYSRDGRKIAKISDILFDSAGNRAEFALVKMEYKGVRGKKFAIPFSVPSYRGKKISVKNDFADAMIEYAAN